MTPDQFEKLLSVLERVSVKQPYTITGAADWPLLLVLGGLIVAVIAFMWRDLKAGYAADKAERQREFTMHKDESREQLSEHKQENKEQFDYVWTAIRDCQHECCPRKKE